MVLKLSAQPLKTLIGCVSVVLLGLNLDSLPLCEMPFQAIGAAFFIVGTIYGTKKESFGMETGKKKEYPYKLATLRDRGGDLTKEWYIEFYAWDENVNDLVRKRKKISMLFQDKKSRTNEGNRLIGIANAALKSGHYYKKVSVESPTDKATKSNDLISSLNYIIQLLGSGLAPKTVVTYQSAVNKLELFAAGNRFLLSEFTSKDAIHFRDYLITTTGNSPRTANNTLQHLAALFAHYQERSQEKTNPFKIKSLREPATDKNIAISDPDRAILEAYMIEHEPELYLFTRFVYLAFIRPGELLQLNINDINMKGNYISVHGLISKNRKTETAQIIKPLEREIISRVDFSKPDKLLFSLSMLPGYTECAKQVPFRRHEKVLKACGLGDRGYTLYSWKHTGAVNAYRSGVGIKELQSMLRHSSVQITDIYLKSLGLRTDPNLNKYEW